MSELASVSSRRKCPLTPLENEFGRRGGQAGYEGGFVEHYLVPILYPGVMPGSLVVKYLDDNAALDRLSIWCDGVAE